jgi:SAM-dependent methyltransferase
MLTPVYRQVNAVLMVVAQTNHQPDPSAQQTLVTQLLDPLLARRRPARILVLKHAGTSDLPLELVSPAQVVRLSTDECSVDVQVKCRITALPFEEAAFDLVVLHHLLRDGDEALMTETLRVLSAGGDLVISGLNSSGMRNRFGNQQQQVPALKLNRICHFLKAHSFKVENCLLMGLAGMSRPAPRATWFGFGLPFADRVVVHGHHQSNITNVSILRFKQMRSSRVTSAALDGVSSRKAAS